MQDESSPRTLQQTPSTHALGAGAAGAVALGALALGAVALGAFAIGRLSVAHARIGRLEIGELRVGRLQLPGDGAVGEDDRVHDRTGARSHSRRD